MPIVRYDSRVRRLAPDIQTEWGNYTNQYVTYPGDVYKYRQPGVPMVARGFHDAIHPPRPGEAPLRSISPFGGSVGNYLGQDQPSKTTDLIKTIAIVAGIALILYLVFSAGKDSGGSKRNPQPGQKKRMTKSGRKRLRRFSNTRKRDSSGRFV